MVPPNTFVPPFRRVPAGVSITFRCAHTDVQVPASNSAERQARVNLIKTKSSLPEIHRSVKALLNPFTAGDLSDSRQN